MHDRLVRWLVWLDVLVLAMYVVGGQIPASIS
jgi:hypothetical protein